MAAETLDVASMVPNKFEPKRKNRWVLMVEGIDAYIITSTSRPSMQTNEIEIPWINKVRYVAGKTKFGTMPMVLNDAIAPSAAQQVMEWLRTCYENVSGRAGYADFYKRDIQLKLLDPVGTVVELWSITGAFPTDIQFGDLSHEASGDLVTVSLTLRFDDAVLHF